MVTTFLVMLVALWTLGVVNAYTLGGMIHILLVLAVVLIAFQMAPGGRRSV